MLAALPWKSPACTVIGDVSVVIDHGLNAWPRAADPAVRSRFAKLLTGLLSR